MNLQEYNPEKGVGLIIVIMALTFLLTTGVLLVSLASTGSKVAGNVRAQEQAFNVAEAGFDASWKLMDNFFGGGGWTDFEGHYITQPYGIEDPTSDFFHRKMTDKEILDYIDSDGDGIADVDNVIYCRQQFVEKISGGLDPRFHYTVFLIDDEAGAIVAGGPADPEDALMIVIGCVGSGDDMISVRLEIELGMESASGGG